MKSKAIITLCLVFAILFSTVACTQTNRLSTPEQIRITNNTILQWNSVGGAEKYAILIDDYEEATTAETKFDLSSLSLTAGQSYTVKVKAIGNGTLSDSLASQSITYMPGSASTNIPSDTTQTTLTPDKPDGSFPVYNTHDNFFYIAHPSKSIEIKQAFTDNEYQYYYFYLGYLENFPLVYSPSQYIIPNGSTVTFSKSMYAESIESIEDAVSNSVSVSETSSSSWTKELGVKLGFEGVSISKLPTFDLEVEAKTGVTDVWEDSKTTTHTLTHTVAESWATGVTETVSQTFDSTSPTGHYRYVRYAKRCDVYALAVYNIDAEAFGWTYITYANTDVTNMGETIEFSTSNTFASDRTTKLEFDDQKYLSEINTAQTLPFRSTAPEEMVSTPICYPMTSQLCAENQDYNLNKPYNDDYIKNGEYDHGSYTIGSFVLYGCYQNKNGTITVLDPNKFKIEFIFNEDPAHLPNEKNNELYVTSDTAKTVYGTDLQNGEELGKGAYYITIKLKDGSSLKPTVGLNFMDKKTKGSVITVLDGFAISVEEIATIEITAVYELQYYSGWFDHHFTNWRFDQTITFQ
ncbi:MAG: hypothetical protein IJW46_07060 [Clostridia bacterium]|nr:hypothetical protein [Clostridia bacterium]